MRTRWRDPALQRITSPHSASRRPPIMKFSPFGQPRMLAIFCIAIALSACSDSAPPLPTLDIDAQRVSVSGISSGAYMAHQVHIALSTRIAGAGLIAGGPYGCAGGELSRALEQCMATTGSGPDSLALAADVRARADSGLIDPLRGLDDDRVWIFHGDADVTVAAAVTAAVAPLYAALSPTLQVENRTRAGVAHVYPTLANGGDCDKTAAPFIGRCDFDAAGEIFRNVVGVEDMPTAVPSGDLLRFDQAPFGGDDDALLDDVGYVYVPTQCRDRACGLHIVFHGCQQSAETIGTTFIDGSGYQRWADFSDVVLIYPQTRSSLMPLNPKACWDWWGYSGDDYDSRSGVQIAWVGRLLDALGVRAP